MVPARLVQTHEESSALCAEVSRHASAVCQLAAILAILASIVDGLVGYASAQKNKKVLPNM